MVPSISTRSLHWFKKVILFTCLSILATCTFCKIEQLLNQSVYEYHVESSRMEPCGAWHFPVKIPTHASSPLYHYSFSEEVNYMKLSFSTPHFKSYTNRSEQQFDGLYTSVQSITVEPEKQLITFIHRRVLTTQTIKQNSTNPPLALGNSFPE